LFTFSSGMAQVGQDSSQVSSVKIKSPGKAVIRSALIPGLGQWYNEQKLKAVLVFGGELGLIANAVYQNQKAVESQTPWEREFYVNNRSLSLWWFAGIYFLNLLDAYVDAHLWDFDVGPELSYNCSKKIVNNCLLTLTFNF
jgi:hypothetical protein